LHSALNDVLLRGAPATELKRSWEQSRQQFPQGSLHLRFSDNHDEARAIARFGCNGALAASAFMFTLDGVPLLYNGMETGDATESGDPALFEKMPVFWRSKDRPPFREIYKSLFQLRKQYPAFQNNSVTWLRNSDEANVVSFMRSDTKDAFVVVINFCNRPVNVKVEVPNQDGFKPVRISGMPEAPAAGFPQLRLTGFEWRIYHRSLQ
jgi:cyclomaltodextrinase